MKHGTNSSLSGLTGEWIWNIGVSIALGWHFRSIAVGLVCLTVLAALDRTVRRVT
jgi:hypothetical protein